MSDPFKGYKEKSIEILKKFKVQVWSDVVIETTEGEFSGLILPRAETAPDSYIILKMISGYNIGISINRISNIIQSGIKEADYQIPEKEFPVGKDKPNVTLLGTGGTIASRLDYRTGAVIPAFTPGELYGAVPELADVCNMNTKKIFGIFSENMGQEQYIKLAEAIGEEIEKGVSGILIGHGTDTMHHTAAVLSYMVQDSPVPIVLVGSQRSSDRPSSDAALNLRCGTYAAAKGDIAEVLVCMFGPTSDSYNLLHRGTRVRKMHSSYRDTFRSIGDIPVAIVTTDNIQLLRNDFIKRDQTRKPLIKPYFNDMVSIVYYYPGMRPDIIDSLVDNGYKGIIIAGTGLGHVNRPLFDPIKRAVDKGISIFMTVQTLWGFVQMYVYDTGRDLMEAGVVPLENMLPEAAYMKLCWTLGQTDDVSKIKEIMTNSIANETTQREPHDGYIILQGGLPEVQGFISQNIM